MLVSPVKPKSCWLCPSDFSVSGHPPQLVVAQFIARRYAICYIRTYVAERLKSFPLLAGGLRGVWEGHPCPDTPDKSGNYNLKCVSPDMYVLSVIQTIM